jgi:guanosine-3',5'-bis(diphosphate) 3'-pyrophosphohydrolase
VFEMAEPSHLASVLAAVRKVEGVFDVYRLTGAKAAKHPVIRA